MMRRYGKSLRAEIKKISENPNLALDMSQQEYGILYERVHKTRQLYSKLPVIMMNVRTGERQLVTSTKVCKGD
jgi:hypothetical protein